MQQEGAVSLWDVVDEMFSRKVQGKCPFCGKVVDDSEFRDERSRREFKISGLCQKCQDEFFGR